MIVAVKKKVFGREVYGIGTTAPGDPGQAVVDAVKPGNPFWAWPSVQAQGLVAMIDFNYGTGFSWGNGAPICPSTAAECNAILAELATDGPAPEDVITWKTTP